MPEASNEKAVSTSPNSPFRDVIFCQKKGGGNSPPKAIEPMDTAVGAANIAEEEEDAGSCVPALARLANLRKYVLLHGVTSTADQ